MVFIRRWSITQCKSKKRKCCFVAVIFITVGEMVVLVTMAVSWRLSRSAKLAPREEQMCLPCDRFISAGEEGDLSGLRKDFNEKRNLTDCCGNAGLVLRKLADKGVADRYNSDANPEIANLNLTEYDCRTKKASEPAAKLMGMALHKTPVQVGASSKIFWNSSAPSYVKPGLKYLHDDGTLYVETPGLYFIFSQMKTQAESAKNADDISGESIRHYVHLISHKRGEGTNILEDVRTPCELTTDASELTSGVGAAFNLEAGDRLYVATSHPERVLPDRISNYLSVHVM